MANDTRAAQDAYGALLDHLSTCGNCEDRIGCPQAQRLRAAYRALRAPARYCRHCNEIAVDPVIVSHELGCSGPGWTIWACRDHADDVTIDDDLLRIMTRIWTVQARED